VNNAGVYEFSPIENVTTNTTANSTTLMFSACFLPHVKQRNISQGRWKHRQHQLLVSQASIPNASAYSGTKVRGRDYALPFGRTRTTQDSREFDQPGMVITEGVKTADSKALISRRTSKSGLRLDALDSRKISRRRQCSLLRETQPGSLAKHSSSLAVCAKRKGRQKTARLR